MATEKIGVLMLSAMHYSGCFAMQPCCIHIWSYNRPYIWSYACMTNHYPRLDMNLDVSEELSNDKNIMFQYMV